MGLDHVELLMEVEEQFEIEIPDEDFVELKTVWLLYQYVLEKQQKSKVPYATDRTTFIIQQYFKVRNDLMEWTGVPRKHFRPSLALADIVGSRSRRQFWKQLGDKLKLELPDLEIPEREQCPALLCFVISGGAALYFFFGHPVVEQWPMLWATAGACILVFILCFVFAKISELLARAIPQRCSTVGDLVRLTKVPDDYGVRLENVGASEEQIFRRLQKIIAEIGARQIEEVVFEARFIEDLRFDS